MHIFGRSDSDLAPQSLTPTRYRPRSRHESQRRPLAGDSESAQLLDGNFEPFDFRASALVLGGPSRALGLKPVRRSTEQQLVSY